MKQGLSQKQQAFIEFYLQTWNASEAARRAGYSEKTARAIGAENLTKPDIQAAISDRLAEMKMSADEVLTRLAEQARGSLKPFLRVNRAGDLSGFDLSEGQPLHLLKKASHSKRTYKDTTEETVAIELYDAQAALNLIGRHHKLFTDVTEHTGSVGIKTYQTVSPDDWDDSNDSPPTK